MKRNSSAAQIEHRDKRLGRVEAERATSDHPQAIVGPFDNPISQRHASIRAWAWARVVNQCSFRHSSRKRPLKDSM